MVLDKRMEFLVLPLFSLAVAAVVIGLARRKGQNTQSPPRGMEKSQIPSFRTPTTQCPHCFETIRWEATVCRHCGVATAEHSSEEDSFESNQQEDGRNKAKARKSVQILLFSLLSLIFLLLGAVLPVWPFLLAGSVIFGVLAFLDWRASRGSPGEDG
jgi:hypothetical protein